MEPVSNSSGEPTPIRRNKRKRPPIVVDDPFVVGSQSPPPQRKESRRSKVQHSKAQHSEIQQGGTHRPEVQQRETRRTEQPRYPTRSVSPPEPTSPAVAPVWLAISRAVAFFLGLLTLLNLFGERDVTQLSAHFWWIDLRLWSPQIARGMMGVAAVIFLLFAAITHFPRYLRIIAIIVTFTLLLVSIKNSYFFYQQLNSGEIYSVAFFPVSLYTAMLLAFVFIGLLTESGMQKDAGRAFLLGAVTFMLCLIEFPLAQMYCEGKTDYRREAEVAVVFNTQAKGDKNPARTLEEQMQTACELYQTGLVSKLILSGGIGKGDVHDTTLMQQYAIKHNVSPADILLDQRESNRISQQDIKRISTLMMPDEIEGEKSDKPEQVKPFLIVTHFYQQPRIQLYCKQQGLVTYTVPAKETGKTTLLKSPIPHEALRLWMTWLNSFSRQ